MSSDVDLSIVCLIVLNQLIENADSRNAEYLAHAKYAFHVIVLWLSKGEAVAISHRGGIEQDVPRFQPASEGQPL